MLRAYPVKSDIFIENYDRFQLITSINAMGPC